MKTISVSNDASGRSLLPRSPTTRRPVRGTQPQSLIDAATDLAQQLLLA